MQSAPIVLFVYNRPSHTRRTLETLANNEGSKNATLYIFADGPKRNDPDLLEKIRQTRAVICEKQWCGQVHIQESESNKGLSRSVIEGVTQVVNEHGSVIVLEDDMETAPYFLDYVNDALICYKDDPKVACIAGYIYPVQGRLPETFFLKGADCWGWATWKEKWQLFEPDGKKLLAQLEERSLTAAFDFDHTYPYTSMLQDQIAGKNDSWAVRWYAAAFLADTYCLYPGVSLVQNIGNDGSGTHAEASDRYKSDLANERIRVVSIPVQDHIGARELVKAYFRSITGKPGFTKRMKALLKRIVKK
jgi:hypothetical protein